MKKRENHGLSVPCSPLEESLQLHTWQTSVHLKLKFNNFHCDPVTINADLEEAKRIY